MPSRRIDISEQNLEASKIMQSWLDNSEGLDWESYWDMKATDELKQWAAQLEERFEQEAQLGI